MYVQCSGVRIHNTTVNTQSNNKQNSFKQLIFSMKRGTYENDLLHSAFVQWLGKDIHVK